VTVGLSETFSSKPLPPLDAQQLLPKPYFSNLKEMNAIPELSQDLMADSIIPSAPPPLPSKPLLDKHGKLLTKRELNEVSTIMLLEHTETQGLYCSSGRNKRSLDILNFQRQTLQIWLEYGEKQKPFDYGTL